MCLPGERKEERFEDFDGAISATTWVPCKEREAEEDKGMKGLPE